MSQVPKTKEAEVVLISCTEDPVYSLFSAWAQSRPTEYPELFAYMEKEEFGSVVTHHIVWNAIDAGVLTKEKVEGVFKHVIAMSIPVTESVHFTWGFSNLPVSWREQAVRKRQWGFWLTSMREFGMDDFVEDGRYRATNLEGKSPESIQVYHDFMKSSEDTYNKLKSMGWAQEEARDVIPMSATHNGTMFAHLRTLIDTLSARSCWVAQVDLWAPVITGMVSELRKVHPLLGLIVSPPCFKRFDDKYQGCKYELIQLNRLSKKDPYAVCPLYATNQMAGRHDLTQLRINNHEEWIKAMRDAGVDELYIQQGERLLPIWETIWSRDAFTGRPL